MKTKFVLHIHEKIKDFDEFINSICNKEKVSIAGFVKFYKKLSIDKRKILSDKLYKESFLNNVEIEKLSRNEIMKIFTIGIFFENLKKRKLSDIIKILKKSDNFLFYKKYLFISLDYIIFYLLCEKKINFFQDLEKFIENYENILQTSKKVIKEIYNTENFEKLISINELILFSSIDNLCKKNNLKLSPLSLEELIIEIVIASCSKNISEALETSIEDYIFGKIK